MAATWDPSQYLRYGGERLQPALDLLARVPVAAPARVVDLGCGPGNVTAMLAARWPEAAVTGIDSSPAMLARAAEAAPHARFVLADIAAWRPDAAPSDAALPDAARPDAAPDVIYSNAALHWLGGHATLLPRLLGCLAPGGTLAVQMPLMHAAPVRRLQAELAVIGPWAATLAGITSAPDVGEPGAYWDMLRPHAAALDIWETTYLHALAGEDAVVQWASGSSLRPYLDALPDAMRPGFLRAYAEALRPHYPRRPDGATLLPFRRLFLLARTGA